MYTDYSLAVLAVLPRLCISPDLSADSNFVQQRSVNITLQRNFYVPLGPVDV